MSASMIRKIQLPEKEELYSNLNMENNTDADYMPAKRTCKDFEKELGDYHHLYLSSDAFNNFRIRHFKIFHLDHVKFPSAPRLAWQTG